MGIRFKDMKMKKMTSQSSNEAQHHIITGELKLKAQMMASIADLHSVRAQAVR